MCLKLKILLASLIICVLTSCGGDKTIIDPEFKVFVSDFEQKIGVKVQNIIIKFSPTKYPIIGMCITGGETNEIHIDPQNWMGINKDGQELILYHELGHCILGLPHDDRRSTLDNVSVEGSIMNTYFLVIEAITLSIKKITKEPLEIILSYRKRFPCRYGTKLFLCSNS